MTCPTWTVLVFENFPSDRELYRQCLLADSSYSYRLLEADCAIAGLELCRTQAIDAILLNYSLPDADGLAFLEALYAQSSGGNPPVVMVAGEGNEKIAVRAIKLGAEDYLVKRCITPELLQLTMRSAIENARLRLQLRQSEERYRAIVETQTELVCRFLPDCTLTFVNQAYSRYFGSTPDRLVGQSFLTLIPESNRATAQQQIAELSTATPENAVIAHEHPVLKSDGEIGWQQWINRAIFDDHGQLVEFQATGRDISAQKQAERTLQEANQQITTIWESMSDAYITLDRQWRVIYANQAAIQVIRQLVALEPEEFLGQTHWNIFPWSMGQIVEQEYRRAVADQVAVHIEVLYEPTGNWFEIHAYPSTEGLGIYFRDISDRKQTEETVRQQLGEIEAIYRAAPIGLCFVDTDLRYVRINERLANINGLPVSEHMGRTLYEILPEISDRLERLYRQVIESGEPLLDLEVSGTNRAQPGILRHWLSSYYPQKDPHGRVLGVNIMVQEITERKQAEAERQQVETALRKSEQKFSAIFNQTFELIGLLSLDGVLLEVNQAALDSIGVQHSDISGRWFWETPWWTHSSQLQTQLQEAIAQAASGKFIRYEVQFPDAGGTLMTTDFSLKPVFDEAGRQVVMLIAEGRDISDRKRVETERDALLVQAQAARAAAEAANRSKDDFVAVVAHELRSPLNSIAGWAQLLQTRKFDEATVSKALQTIARNTQVQVQLIEDLLDVSRMVRGMLQINLVPVNLVEAIEAALEIVRPMVEAKHIHLHTHLSITPQIAGDFNRLQQIVVNLLTNAIKFTPQQGQIDIGLEQIDSQVELCVSDTGKGIAPQLLSLIFERYKQGQENTGSKDGLGLGLAIVKHLVELHCGTIAAKSAGQGEGATFTVRLPILSASEQKDDTPVISDATSLAGIRILVVDDELDMLNLITFILEESGAEVQAETNAADALERLPQFKPDILVSDIAMPEGNGYELLQQMRSHLEGDIPAIALTAYASTTYEEKSLQAGFQQHLTKPVEPEMLVAAIFDLTRGRKP